MRFDRTSIIFIQTLLLLIFSGACALSQTNLERISQAVAVDPTVPAIICQAGDKLHIAGDIALDRSYDTCDLLIDGSLISRHAPTLGTDHYDFNWTPTVAKTYTLQWIYSMETGGKLRSRHLLVIATDSVPYRFVNLPDQAASDTSVQVQAAGEHPLSLSRVDFYFNGSPVSAVVSPPFSVTLPIAAESKPGKYSVRFIAYDSLGRPYVGHPEYIEVPQRIRVALPQIVTLKTSQDAVPIGVSLVPGISLSQVSYFISRPSSNDWQSLGKSLSAPYISEMDLTKYPSGSYQIKAQATSASGITYETALSAFTLKNVPDDTRLVRIAKTQADIDAKNALTLANARESQLALDHVQSEKEANLKLFLPRPGFDEKIFRKQLAELAFYEPPPHRTGYVGTVTGLAVIESVNRDGEILSQRGSTQTITALVRPGSGQVNWLAFSEEDARLSAQQAAEYCKMKTSFQHWDWSKYDVSVAFSDNSLKLGGPSAGLADTVAIMSAVMGQPVDNSVAMTGAITLQGQVQPVGGVNLKAEAAFGDADVHTLIVPQDAATSDLLFSLYTTEPQLCFSRRVIMVTTADQAFEQSIIGWQSFNRDKEEHLMQGGIRHFSRGEDKLALAAFQAARDIDPANWTIGFWIKMVNLVHQQNFGDQAADTNASDTITK